MCVTEDYNTRLKKYMYSVNKCPLIFIFIPFCLIFYLFVILFIYIINIGYWQALFIARNNKENLTLQLPFLNARGPLQLYLFFLQEFEEWRIKTYTLMLKKCKNNWKSYKSKDTETKRFRFSFFFRKQWKNIWIVFLW